MRTGLTISCAGHAAILAWSVLTLVARPYHTEATEALPIDIVSTTEFSKMTSGTKDAQPVEKPKPVADKVAELPPPPPDPTAKVANKEIKAATDVPPPPPVQKPPEPKAKKPPQPPAPAVDQIADVLKNNEDKKPDPKKPDPKPPTPQKKPVQQETPAFDPIKIAEALLNKQTPQRLASAGNEVSSIPKVGTAKGSDDKITQNELAAMQAKILRLWIVPLGAKDQVISFDINIHLNPDGTLTAPPKVPTAGDSPLIVAAKESAIRAILQGQPYTMLRSDHYEEWKDFTITFNPVFTNAY